MSFKIFVLLLVATFALAQHAEEILVALNNDPYIGKRTIDDPRISGNERLVKPDDMLVTDPNEFYSNDEGTEMNKEDTDIDLVQNDDKHKGLCHWGVSSWHKPGFAIRCSCLKCVCQNGGVWNCAYEFAYCPFYYCGNVLYNPATQTCCCGKVYDKKANFVCCGYAYYDTKAAKCCNYYSIKQRSASCPRYQV